MKTILIAEHHRPTLEGERGDASTARKKRLRVLEMNPGPKIAKAALPRVRR